MRDILLGAVRASLVMWVLCGLAYPLALTGLAQVLMPWQANGSLQTDAQGRTVGSRLIGQRWDGPEWFHGRASAITQPDPQDPSKSVAAPYDPTNSGGSNLGPTSKGLAERLAVDRAALEAAQPELAGRALPSDMLTASASGLDPDISPANAALQIPRVARARGVPATDIEALVAQHVAGRVLGVLGEPRVNVLALNLALERAYPAARRVSVDVAE